MTYFFSGVIAPGAGVECAEWLVETFGGRWRSLPGSEGGVVVAFASDMEKFDDSDALRSDLVAASRQFPTQPFVFIRVECFGGVCDQWGIAFADGEVVLRDEDEDARPPPTPLQNLLAACGVDLTTPYFEPFTRDWFSSAHGRQALSNADFMWRALSLALPGVGQTGDNPSVGCVIVKDGVVVGEGATAAGGRPHAEELALQAAGAHARGATAYVTLEPCDKRSTGAASCSDSLIQAGVARVVIAASDPHPFANGAGVERLRAAGISVETGLLASEAQQLNADFHRRWTQS